MELGSGERSWDLSATKLRPWALPGFPAPAPAPSRFLSLRAPSPKPQPLHCRQRGASRPPRASAGSRYDSARGRAQGWPWPGACSCAPEARALRCPDLSFPLGAGGAWGLRGPGLGGQGKDCGVRVPGVCGEGPESPRSVWGVREDVGAR